MLSFLMIKTYFWSRRSHLTSSRQTGDRSAREQLPIPSRVVDCFLKQKLEHKYKLSKAADYDDDDEDDAEDETHEMRVDPTLDFALRTLRSSCSYHPRVPVPPPLFLPSSLVSRAPPILLLLSTLLTATPAAVVYVRRHTKTCPRLHVSIRTLVT